MPPPLSTIPLPALASELNVHPSGRPRNPPLTLTDCALKELVQYKCNLHVDRDASGRQVGAPSVVCEPVVRLLRMCENGVSVETTAWEGWRKRQEGKVEGT
ncbi:hypothetical protein IQ07DRAFT_584840 [Pyrenochaeta sp. DS3sAY3a]|nr:hypothetical protein IQ07DRAFT_584840 [Pyrenochaeta sp. DS3sAY3a]